MSEPFDESVNRVEFEFWASNEGRYPAAVETDGEGHYLLLQTQMFWSAWRAARATPTVTDRRPRHPIECPCVRCHPEHGPK